MTELEIKAFLYKVQVVGFNSMLDRSRKFVKPPPRDNVSWRVKEYVLATERKINAFLFGNFLRVKLNANASSKGNPG